MAELEDFLSSDWDYESIGKMAAAFNFLEVAQHLVAWRWIGGDVAHTQAATANLPFAALLDLLRRLAESDGIDLQTSLRDGELDGFDYAVAVLIDNAAETGRRRNELLHSSFTVQGLAWMKRSMKTGRYEEIPAPKRAGEVLLSTLACSAQAFEVLRMLKRRSGAG